MACTSSRSTRVGAAETERVRPGSRDNDLTPSLCHDSLQLYGPGRPPSCARVRIRSSHKGSYRARHADTLLSTAPQPAHKEFPYLNILGADLTTSDKDGRTHIEIRALDLKQHEGVAIVRGLIQKDQAAEAETWVSQLLAKAYREPSCCSSALVKAAHARASWTATTRSARHVPWQAAARPHQPGFWRRESQREVDQAGRTYLPLGWMRPRCHL